MKSKSIKSFLLETAEGAGKVLMQRFRKAQRVERKRKAGIVTEADHAAEAFILKQIYRYFPNSSIIAEESGEIPSGGSHCWVVDPLDGTTNYAHGFPWFCVSIGLHVDGKPKAGAIFHPSAGEMFFGEVGKGAFLNGKRLKVSTVSSLKDALFGTGFYYAKGQKLAREIELFRRMNDAALGVRRPGAAALDLAYVACGRYEGFWERGLSPWDVAAGMILVSEAGGKISDYSGKPTGIFDREVLATNGLVHRKVVNVFQRPYV